MPDQPTPMVDVVVCPQCGTLDPGPRELCPVCFAPGLEPQQVDGKGELVSWTIIRRPPTAFRDEGAYAVAVVTLDAGVQVTGRLERRERDPTPGARVTAIASKEGVPTFAPDP